MANTRTLAFQISEELYQKIKAHLQQESRRLGRKVSQKEFVLGLIEQSLNAIEELNSYIHWYNEKRIKQSLGAMSPHEYRHSLGLEA